jgi:hypothetical protein
MLLYKNNFADNPLTDTEQLGASQSNMVSMQKFGMSMAQENVHQRADWAMTRWNLLA